MVDYVSMMEYKWQQMVEHKQLLVEFVLADYENQKML